VKTCGKTAYSAKSCTPYPRGLFIHPMGEAKRRREAIARGEPDPGIVGFKNLGRRGVSAQCLLSIEGVSRRNIVDALVAWAQAVQEMAA
jgi:hypothetical protein